MPVIIALLNSFSGLAASAAGFIISNEALVVAGCLVGASGLILTFSMCRAMNRSLKNVLFGNFGNLSALHFEKPDTAVFGALRLAYEAGMRGGNAPTVFNAADECAVKAFLSGKIPYTGIAEMIEEAMARIPYDEAPDLEAVFETERAVREAFS